MAGKIIVSFRGEDVAMSSHSDHTLIFVEDNVIEFSPENMTDLSAGKTYVTSAIEEALLREEAPLTIRCPICLEGKSVDQMMRFYCKHILCYTCVDSLQDVSRCPSCMQSLDIIKISDLKEAFILCLGLNKVIVREENRRHEAAAAAVQSAQTKRTLLFGAGLTAGVAGLLIAYKYLKK